MKRGDQASHSPAQASASAPRAALYMRVSTGRQAEHDLSIPDQRRQLEAWCRVQGYAVASEFIEGGASAGDDRRPVFQQMIERACDGEHAFDLVLVHSYSRFFREAFEQEFIFGSWPSMASGSSPSHSRSVMRTNRSMQ